MDITFHYPPELLQLLIDAIPRLCKTKPDVLLFFQGAGIPKDLMADIAEQLKTNKDSVNKFSMARTILARINEKGERTLRERRELLKRVVEFEDFSTCWPNDQLQAKGLVAEIRRVVNVKDTFTRMTIEKDNEAATRKAAALAKEQERAQLESRIGQAQAKFAVAVRETNAQKRGKLLEDAANSLFQAYGIIVREAFTVVPDKGAHVLEQIDGVIDLDGHLYFVEMKWLAGPVGVDDVSRHLVRIYHRGHARGLFVSATEFGAPALQTCREALQRTVVSLVLVEELLLVLERRLDLKSLLRAKLHAAQTDKAPFVRVDLSKLPVAGIT